MHLLWLCLSNCIRICCSCINLSYSSLYYYYAHVGQVETSVRISAMVTGIARSEPRLEHFPFILFPFILLSFYPFSFCTHLVQSNGPAPTGCNPMVLHQLGATHWSCTRWVQYISPAPTWYNANTIAPSLAYIRASLWIIKSFHQLTNWSSCKLCEWLGTGSKIYEFGFFNRYTDLLNVTEKICT